MNIKKWLLLAVLAVAIGAFYTLDGQQYLTRDFFQGLYRDDPVLTAAAFSCHLRGCKRPFTTWSCSPYRCGGCHFWLVPWTIAGFFLPVPWVLLWLFCLSRTLLRDWVEQKFSGYLDTINKGVKKDGAFYLATLRLIPAVPFFVINLVMGLTLHAGLDIQLGQPAWDAPGDCCLCECRCSTRAVRGVLS